ncbi:MAG: MalY/PatB family protein [Micromonosporaceae bacterium]
MSDPLAAYTLEELKQRRSLKWRHFDADVLPAWVAEMDTPLAPPIAEALHDAVRRGDTGYADPGGLPEAYAEFAGRRYGWQPDPARMVLMPDVMRGIVEILLLITEPGARIVVNTPAYPPFFFWLGHIDRRLVQSPLALTDEGYRLDLDRLERDFAAGAAVYLLCNPQNPTGLVFSRDELLAVASLADRYGVRVVADEIHAPLTYEGVRHVPFGSLPVPAAQRAVTSVSASKAWNLAGLKAALLVAGPESWSEVARIPEEVQYAASLAGVIASEAAFRDGEPWLSSLLASLARNRTLLGELLGPALPGVVYHPPQATYLTWLDCRALGLARDPAEHFLEHGRVALASGPNFGADYTGFVRLNLATAPEHLIEVVRRMAASLPAAGSVPAGSGPSGSEPVLPPPVRSRTDGSP